VKYYTLEAKKRKQAIRLALKDGFWSDLGWNRAAGCGSIYRRGKKNDSDKNLWKLRENFQRESCPECGDAKIVTVLLSTRVIGEF
jgi:predicted RNA-binding Zn-ribbon protein involved in translation (DUF1610 family)